MLTLLTITSINLAIAVLGAVAKENSCQCGVNGVPKDGMSTKSSAGDCSVTYSCNLGTYLIGGHRRKCVGEKFTGSTPICMPAVTKENNNENTHFHGTGLNTLNSDSLKCSEEEFAITFGKLMIRALYVWTNSTCEKLSISTEWGTISEGGSPLKTDVSVAYTFSSLNKPVTAINISASGCCLYRVVIADPTVSIRCGTPDIPVGVEWDQTPNKITFHCGGSYRLDGPKSVVCVGLEKWSHPNETVQCVSDHSSLWLIILGSIVAVVMFIAAFFFAIWYISKSDVAFDSKTLTRQLMDRYRGTKIEYKEVTLVKPRDKEGFCRNYFAQYKKKEVLAHVCDLSVADKKSIPPVEQMRCLYSVVHFDFKHQNIVSVLALSLDPKKNPILVYESSSKGTLLDYIKANKDLTQKDFLALCLNVCDGMIFLSQRGIVHRNLQAKNCFVDDSKIAKIGNFKMAQELGNYDQFLCKVTVSRQQMPWAAPETIAGNVSSVESDVWSFGILIWEVYSRGKEPYESLSDVQITTLLLDEERLTKPKDCPDGLYALMLDCWKTDSAQRPSFAILGINMQQL